MAALRTLELPWRDPTAVACFLAARLGSQGLVLLEGDGSPLGQRAVLGVDPLETVCCRGLPGDPGATDPFAALAALVERGGPWLGWLAYEAGAWVEPSAPWHRSDMATLWAVRHDPLLHFDLGGRRCWLEGRDPARLRAMAALLAALPPAAADPASEALAAADTPAPAAKRAVVAAAQLDSPSGMAGIALGAGTDAAAAPRLQAAVGSAATRPRTMPPGQPETPTEPNALAAPPIPLSAWRWHTTPQRYGDQVERLLRRIAAGDLFQANLTACCEVELAVAPDPLALWQRLRHACPAPFAGVAIAAGGEAVISASPERFLRLHRDGGVETRPIKGTRPRSADPDRDARSAAALVCDPKDRAENVMIVDLLRNDLGRVCQPGSIQVPQLVALESYAQVHHLTSVVRGQLQPGRDLVALLRACWPGGSISGAPKVRACSRLHALEPVPRGPYCGSLFHLQADGGFDSSIVIRSVMQRGRRLRVHAGGGIVADSDPAAEAEEMGWKIRPLLEALA
ncbi:MAG: anthranilate synthase component I family protein [Cyanobium sp.]